MTDFMFDHLVCNTHLGDIRIAFQNVKALLQISLRA